MIPPQISPYFGCGHAVFTRLSFEPTCPVLPRVISWWLGNVKVLAHPVTSGHVTAFLHDVKYEGLSGVHETIESSAPLAHGNSGGPLVDAEGRVVGLNVAELLGTKTGVTLPADLVIKVVRRLIGAG